MPRKKPNPNSITCVFYDLVCTSSNLLARGLCEKHYHLEKRAGRLAHYPKRRVRGGSPEAREAQIVVRVPKELLRRLKKVARERAKSGRGSMSGGTLRAVVREAIEKGLGGVAACPPHSSLMRKLLNA